MREGDRETESRIAVAIDDRPRLSLLVMGERGVFTYALPEKGVLRIGRAEHCEVAVGDAQLSREHARLFVGPTLEIVDLGSSNGTCIDGRPLVPHEAAPLLPENVVTMGNTVFIVKHAKPNEEEGAPEPPREQMGERSPTKDADRERSRPTMPPLHVSARVTDALARDPEAARLLAVLDACDWNQTKAAVELGVSRRTLVSRLSAYGLTRKRTR